MRKIDPNNKKETIAALINIMNEGKGKVKFTSADTHNDYPPYVMEAIQEERGFHVLYGNKKVIFVNKSDAIDYCIKKEKVLHRFFYGGANMNELEGDFFEDLVVDGVKVTVRCDKEILNYGFSYDDIAGAKNFSNKRMLTSAKRGKLSKNFIELFKDFMKSMVK